MKFRVWYVPPTDNEAIDAGQCSLADIHNVNWISYMVESNPDCIFFLTVETTDIWGPPPGHTCWCHELGEGACSICKDFGCKVWDFNRVALPPELRMGES